MRAVIQEAVSESPQAWLATLRTISGPVTPSTAMQRLA